jgi:hypothetical protein
LPRRGGALSPGGLWPGQSGGEVDLDEVERVLHAEAVAALEHQQERVVLGALAAIKDQLVVTDRQNVGLGPVGGESRSGGKGERGDDRCYKERFNVRAGFKEKLTRLAVLAAPRSPAG